MNILVTGGTRGIGKAICDELGNSHKIFTAARNEELLKNYENYFVCDLANQDDLVKLGEYIEKNSIDVLINNAGEYIYSPIENITFEQLNRITEVNFKAPLYLISKAIPYMKSKQFGRIINIGSISGVVGEANASLYSATKSGFIGGTKALNPGWVDTEMGNESASDGDFTKEEIVECIPQRRFVEPSEIAGMVKYLISDEAKGLTGQSINLCAGLTCGA